MSKADEEENKMEKIIQIAGRNQLGDFAPDFAHFNDGFAQYSAGRDIYFFLL